MKPLVIYHANCADGFAAAFAAWLKFGGEAEYLPMQYNKIPEIGVFDRDVYILDFNFPREYMDVIFAKAKRVVWLDHHKTAFEIWRGRYEKGMVYKAPLLPDSSWAHTIILDDNKSGAMIAWEYFHPNKEVPLLIQHIDDYDRWQFKIEGTKEFNKALWSYAPWSFEQWETVFLPCNDSGNERNFGYILYLSRLDEGAAILRAHEANVKAVVEGASKQCVIPRSYPLISLTPGEMVGLAANCPPHLASDVGHALATQSGTYGLLWFIDKEGKCLCSLRSNGDYDVSAIAKAFGGGGHKNAAGFEVEISTLLEWIK